MSFASALLETEQNTGHPQAFQVSQVSDSCIVGIECRILGQWMPLIVQKKTFLSDVCARLYKIYLQATAGTFYEYLGGYNSK